MPDQPDNTSAVSIAPPQSAERQTKKGFVRIDNDIPQVLMRTNLSKYQSRVLWAIFQKTFGFNKEEDWISNSQLVDMTRIHKAHISRTIKELLDRNVVTKRGNKLSFNKDFQRWRELPKGATTHSKLPKGATQLPDGVTKVTKRGGHKRKQYTKDNKMSSEISSEISALVSKIFSFPGGNETYSKMLKVISQTRKTERVSQGVILSLLQKLEKFPQENIQAGIRIYLEKEYYREGKKENYLVGIIRNHRPGETRPPQEIKSTGSRLLDAYYREQTGQGVGQ